jgi:hypothetical protein
VAPERLLPLLLLRESGEVAPRPSQPHAIGPRTRPSLPADDLLAAADPPTDHRADPARRGSAPRSSPADSGRRGRRASVTVTPDVYNSQHETCRVGRSRNPDSGRLAAQGS